MALPPRQNGLRSDHVGFQTSSTRSQMTPEKEPFWERFRDPFQDPLRAHLGSENGHQNEPQSDPFLGGPTLLKCSKYKQNLTFGTPVGGPKMTPLSGPCLLLKMVPFGGAFGALWGTFWGLSFEHLFWNVSGSAQEAPGQAGTFMEKSICTNAPAAGLAFICRYPPAARFFAVRRLHAAGTKARASSNASARLTT